MRLTTMLGALLALGISLPLTTNTAGAADQTLGRDLAMLTATIKSRQDLDAYLRFDAARPTPLDALRKSERERFLKGLSFGAGGLASVGVDSLVSLGPTRAYEVLSLFGMQHALLDLKIGPAITQLDWDVLEFTAASNRCMIERLPIAGQWRSSCPGNNLDKVEGAKCSSRVCVTNQGTTCYLSSCS